MFLPEKGASGEAAAKMVIGNDISDICYLIFVLPLTGVQVHAWKVKQELSSEEVHCTFSHGHVGSSAIVGKTQEAVEER